MAENYTQEELNEARFMQLIFSFQATAMQQMGKLMSPLTGKVEKNMEQAKNSIDMIAMLEEKTKGNLSEGEKKLIQRVLFELRMNYVEEMEVVEKESREEVEKGAGEERREPAKKAKPRGRATGKKAAKPAGSRKAKPRRKKKSSA